jgi:outer membrane protein TolC
VAQQLQDRLPSGSRLDWPRTDAARADAERRVAELLSQPLNQEAAVTLALLNNPALQARYESLGIAEADRVQASRLPNPGFSFGRMRRGDEREIERGLHLNLARLLALPWAAAAEDRRFEAAQQALAMHVLALAADTRKAWVQALAAEETLRYTGQVQQAAEASAELARRMEQVGNFSKLQRAREQAFQAEAALNTAHAEQGRRASRERLTRLMGLWGAQTAYTLPERLPDLPTALADRPEIESEALAQRLDVQAARLATAQTARQLGLTQATRWVNVLELGVVRNSSNEAPTQRGWEVAFELPLFDFGGARAARAQAVYLQAMHRAAQTAIDARSEVREAYTAWRSAWDIARHHQDEIVPLRRLIAEENLLRYNGMLIGVFELLADARLQIASVDAAIQARRDFWLAQADLDMAMVGKPSPAPNRAAAGNTQAPVASAGGAH